MRLTVFLALALPAILALVVCVCSPQTIHCTTLGVRVRGRLVEAEGGAPIANAWVLTLSSRVGARDAARVDRYEQWAREHLKEAEDARARGQPPPPPWSAPPAGGGTTDEGGAFEIDAGVPWSWRSVGGLRLGSTRPPPRKGVRVLLVRAPGRADVLVDVPAGTWHEHAGRPERLWATWDLGDVRVPRPDG